MELAQLKLSENLLPAIERNALLEVIGPPEEMLFDETGDLLGSPLVEEFAAH